MINKKQKLILNRLLGYLSAKMMFTPDGEGVLNCSGNLFLTAHYFHEIEKLDKDEANEFIKFFKENDGHCDCEVLINCADKIKKLD
jgi:hypothetical protein